MSTDNNGALEPDQTERLAEALEQIANALRESPEVSIAQFRGRSSENYILGLVQMQEHVARAQYESARVAAQANTLAIMASIGISFNAQGKLSDDDENALLNAQDFIKEAAVQLHPLLPL